MTVNEGFSIRLATRLAVASMAILLPAAALASPAIAGLHDRTDTIACQAGATRAWYGLPSDSGAGHAYYWFQVSNVGRSTCTITGHPRVTAIDGHGHQVGLPAALLGRRTAVTLKPSGTAYFVLDYIGVLVQCAHPLNATEISVTLPGQSQGDSVPFPTRGCRAESVLDAYALHPGAGIPQRSPR